MRNVYWMLGGGILLAFLSGSVLYSSILPRALSKKDITRMSDDGNPGAFNAFRYAGKAVGALCLVCDILKGALPVMLMSPLYLRHPALFGALIAAPVFGHAFSPFAGMHGGKGIAVSFGIMLGLFPQFPELVWLIVLYLGFSLVIRVDPNQWRSVLTFTAFALLALRFEEYFGMRLGVLLVCAAVLYRHCLGLHRQAMQISLFRRRLVTLRSLQEMVERRRAQKDCFSKRQ